MTATYSLILVLNGYIYIQNVLLVLNFSTFLLFISTQFDRTVFPTHGVIQISNLIYYYVANVLVIVHTVEIVWKSNKQQVEADLKPHLKHNMHRSVSLSTEMISSKSDSSMMAILFLE